MDNQDSAPSIIFPNVPDDFCPTGNWADVLQEFIDQILSNGTINVPGLGDVTPEEIATINETLADLQNQINAIEDNFIVRKGTITSVPVGDSIQTVSFAAFATNVFYAGITPFCNGTIGTSATPLFAIVDGSKTTTGFSIRVENNISQITQIDWVAIYSV
jgi:hypothetical protein